MDSAVIAEMFLLSVDESYSQRSLLQDLTGTIFYLFIPGLNCADLIHVV
jgi:hypothetical protein